MEELAHNRFLFNSDGKMCQCTHTCKRTQNKLHRGARDGQHVHELYNNIRSADSDTNLTMNMQNYHYCQIPTEEMTLMRYEHKPLF